MKKILSVLSLVAILGMSTPAFAAPGGPGGPHHGHGGPKHGGGHHISAGHHHGHHIRPHGGISIHAGHPRHGYWGGCRDSYWYGTYCNPRLGWCDPYYPHYGGYIPYGTSFSIRF